tara:strand:- start:5411 stop:5797 length:387 start_codon:yes stop_codon:yes gene_type:complete
MEFNLSHCDGLVCLVFDNGPIGIDVEKVRPLKDLPDVCDQVFTKKDQNYIFMTEEAETQLEKFYQLWTCKEAELKANGTGLMKNPKSMEIHFGHDKPSTEGTGESKVHWFPSIEGYMIAYSGNKGGES